MLNFYPTGTVQYAYDCKLICLIFILSSAQLLEPFRLNHDIQLISSGGGILSGSAGVPDLDRAPGAPATGMIPANLVVGPTTELEDPPGLYEKVRDYNYGRHL